jgi:hypothetical protein
MAQARPLIHSLNQGEVSVSALARVDQEKARLWAETQENLFPFTIGKAMMRQGTTYLGSAKTAANRVRELAFVKSLAAQAGIEMSVGLLRIWVNDALVTRASVTSTVTNGDFSSSTGWTLTTTGDATADINSTVAGSLYLACPNRGGTATCVRSVSTSSAGTQHALNIVVTRGPVSFRCGSSSGDDDYITETSLDTGTHSLAFTPTGTYYVYFASRLDRGVIVDSIQVESAGTLEFTAPWTEAELRQIQYTQSADIMYLCHRNWQTRKVERRGDASWSLVLYKSDDGPFAAQSTAEKNITITPGQAYGNTTLTASAAVFKSTDVGSLYRVEAGGFNSMFGLGALDAAGEAVRVTGITPDNKVDYVTTGTFVGTLTLQRSYDGAEAGFINTGTGGTMPSTGTETPSSSFNNVTHWYRWAFTAYTSGSANVQLTTGTGGGESGAAQTSGAGNAGVYRVTAFNSSTSVDVEVLGYPSSLSASKFWQRGEFSDRRGWPSAVTFHDGRLIFERDDKFRASESDDFVAFNLDTTGDSASIQRNVATSGAVFNVNALLSLSRLIILTDGAEVPARSDAFDTPLTATNIAMKEADNVGSAARSPVKIGKRGYYIARSGIKIYRLVYNFEQQDYDADDITELHENLGEDHSGFEELAVQRHPQPYVWSPMGDGECAILLTSPKHQVDGWVRLVTDGDVESVAVYQASTEDRVYLWMKRTINGSTVRYREKLCLRTEALGSATTKLADCGTFSAGPASSVTAAQLANETGLVAWGTKVSTGVSGFIGTISSDGATGSLSADASGVIALGDTYTNVFVGLPYRGRYKSAKLAYGAEGGTALMAQKIISEVGLLLMDVHRDALKVGPDFDHMTPFIIKSDTGIVLTDALAVKATHEQNLQPARGSWSPDARVCIQVNAGYPTTIGGIAMTVKTNT